MNKKLSETFVKAMKKEAEISVNSTCWLFCYQPKETQALDKLKKKRNK